MVESTNEKNHNSEAMTTPAAAPEPTKTSITPDKAANSNQELKPNNHSRSRALRWFTFFLIVAGLAWFCYWDFYLKYHESTDDAYANGNLININSVISGAVTAFFADNTDLVKEGQLLVLLDSISYQATYEKELATLATVTLQVKQLYENIQTSRSNIENKRTKLERAKFDYENRLQLRLSNPLAEAAEDFIHAKHDFLAARFEFEQAESELQEALARIGNTPPEQHPLIEQQKNNVRSAFYQLQHCSLYAPSTGYVAQRSVNVGEWITPETNLMAVIPTDYVWVDANFKETQLSNMRIGQPATVWFDLYGSKVIYEGKVIGIASGTGSVFSLIPPQNATGNWIKIVQRLPVRISLDASKTKEFPVRLGISAEVDVNITQQDLPLLATFSPIQPVAQTQVFNIDLDELDKIMNEIVRENLKKSES